MENSKLICKACGGGSFVSGQVGSETSQGNVRPIGSVFSVGSPYIFNFCKDCGEVASIKVTKPQKFT
ncbi:hypothetical protein FC756_10345 [Lysinibacillus mangiferihumi]|uniref:Transcription initiation factor TFIIIB n=1 Tax=Lysinibacillus mangiferihumi TaxID=1130819 RepID=A0A4U2Z6P4_9BACI|nr:hypothetical protein [Lysinibacillus mangiferihumi]TKI68541.1 hypothetical protein FC756_10345 [Lysinibacillus mangiferihumi]